MGVERVAQRTFLTWQVAENIPDVASVFPFFYSVSAIMPYFLWTSREEILARHACASIAACSVFPID
ncbi:hypothetical protein NDU88_002533 [Pleurodeles waltl]|uniref:Uncharacterized protein n=1 Tax=Pleurodeles waltl TaxID=8319 RepID=A0AAV7QD73_PLEWA|nr:hypothetical protein NDU88_002533 [Pleurodeles waltl]